MGKECEFQFLDLDSALWTKTNSQTQSWFSRVSIGSRTYHSWAQVNHSTKSHSFVRHKYIDHDDSVVIFQDRSCEWNKFYDRIFYDPIHIGDYNYVNREEVNKGGFRELPYYFDWVATLGPIRPPPEPPLEVILSSPFFFFIHLSIHSYIKDKAWDRCGGGF